MLVVSPGGLAGRQGAGFPAAFGNCGLDQGSAAVALEGYGGAAALAGGGGEGALAVADSPFMMLDEHNFGGLLVPGAMGLPPAAAGLDAFHPSAGFQMGLAGAMAPPVVQLPRRKQSSGNKASQQRYRERKKARFQELEETVAAMRGRLAELQALQQVNFLLEGENSSLEARLVEQERQIEQLKFMLDRRSDTSLQPPGQELAPSGDPTPAAAAAEACPSNAPAPAASGASGAAEGCTVDCSPLVKDIAELDCGAQWEERMGQLRVLLDSRGLRRADPSGAGVDRAVLHEVAVLVGRCCQIQQAVMAAEGERALALFKAGQWGAGLAADAVRWGEVIQALRLSGEQAGQLLALRRGHLATLRAIYRERQDLNLEAMALMLPRASPLVPAQHDTMTSDGKIALIANKGYLASARGNLQMCELLDSVKETLRREQQAIMDLNRLVISRVLTPLQAALYMAHCYPRMSDALALATALATHLGKEEEEDVEGEGHACCQHGSLGAGAHEAGGPASAGTPTSGEGTAMIPGDTCLRACCPRSYARGEGGILSGCCGGACGGRRRGGAGAAGHLAEGASSACGSACCRAQASGSWA